MMKKTRGSRGVRGSLPKKNVRGYRAERSVKDQRRKCRTPIPIDAEERRSHENIEFMLRFLDSADWRILQKKDYLLRLKQLLSSCLKDEDFEVEFPPQGFDSFLSKKGKPLPCNEGSKCEQFRQKTMPSCGKKLYTMLRDSSFSSQLTATYASYGGEVALYYELYVLAIDVSCSGQPCSSLTYEGVERRQVYA